MSLSNDTSSVSYAGNNSAATAYAIPFKFALAVHLRITVTDADDVATVLSFGDYTVTGAGENSGGTVVTDTAIPSSSVVLIERVMTLSQPYVFAEAQRLPMKTLENALDWQAMGMQQITRGISEVDNTADADKPVSTDQAAALALLVPLTQRGASNGVATLDATGKVASSQIPASSYQLPADAAAFVSLKDTRGLHVDDYYVSGSDMAPAARLAVGDILSTGIETLSFAPREYPLQSSQSTPNALNTICGLKITTTTLRDRLVIDGNGGWFSGAATALRDLLYIEATVKTIIIRNMGFRQVQTTPLTGNLKTAGIGIDPSEANPAIDLILIENCWFEGCNRSLNLGVNAGKWMKLAYGKCKKVLVRNCRFDHPIGCNLDATAFPVGGSQSTYCTAWVYDLEFNNCTFDGANSGDTTGIGNGYSVDGMFIGGAINTTFVNCTLKHYDVEGIFVQKNPTWNGTASGGFTIPAVGLTFNLPIDHSQKTTGWAVGDICYLSTYASGYTAAYSHQFQVTAIPDAYTLTVEVLSGSAGVKSSQYPVVSALYFTRRHSARIINCTFRDILVTSQATYACIVCNGVDDVDVSGNVCDSSRFFVLLGWTKAANVHHNPSIGTTEQGVLYQNPGETCNLNVSDNQIRLLGSGTTLIGIQCSVSNAVIHRNHISMDSAITDKGVGIRMYSSITGIGVEGNVFINLDKNVENETFTGLQYHYGQNTLVNVANPQTAYPPTFANDAAAATGGVNLRGMYLKASGVLAWRQS